jgi:predicted LPLAT superfamily acyltransferase
VKRPAAWIIRIAGWAIAAAMAYAGAIFFVFADMIRPRGSIDYVAFSAAKKRAADWTLSAIE